MLALGDGKIPAVAMGEMLSRADVSGFSHINMEITGNYDFRGERNT